MVDVAVIGSLNMDTVIEVDALPKPGETINGLSINKFPGGKGANQATVLAKLGRSVSLIGKIGNDENGKELQRCLRANGVDLSNLGISSDKATGSAFIVVDKNGHNQIIVSSGANAEVDVDYIQQNMECIKNARMLLMQYEIPVATVEFIIDFANRNKIPVVVNPSPFSQMTHTDIRQVDYLVLNESEAAAYLGNDVTSIESAKEAVFQIFNFGVKHVVLTLGSQGAVICDENGQIEHLPAMKVTAVDTTGSGDAFLGGFLTGILGQKTYRDAVGFANAVGAITVAKLGAQSSLPDMNEVTKFIEEFNVA